MWMPLLNQYRSHRHISTVGEIDCPNPKWFKSPLTQNQFLILLRFSSDNWCLGATFSNQPQVSSMFPPKKLLKTNKSVWNFQLWTEMPRTPHKKKQVAIESSLRLHTRDSLPGLRKRCNNYFTKTFLKILFLILSTSLSRRPVAAKNRR